MKINVSAVLETDGAELEIDLKENIKSLDCIRNDVTFKKLVSVKGKLINFDGIINLNGSLKTEYTAECVRCLKEFECSLDLPVNEEFKAEGKNDDNDDKIEYVYKNNEIELDKVIKDNILLSLPVKHLCWEKCRGICPHCGTNLNESDCNCKEERINPKMEKLKDFFK